MNQRGGSKSFLTQLTRSHQLIGALCFICLEYYIFVFQFIREWFYESDKFYEVILILMFYHIILFLLLWSMYQSIFSDPGKVPTYWGVIMDDPETKKRRYCLICHQFKPERSHHCSTCERCVLNMDHHCPWIMNCIGFQNRKFFILMVFYISLAAVYMVVFETIVGINIIRFTLDQYSLPNLVFKGLGFSVTVLFCLVILNFFNFHIQLLISNSTTIETMEKQKLEQQGQVVTKESTFDYGFKYNWYQVFGLNPYLWPFPMFGDSGKPLGDGVTWDKFRLQEDMQDNNPNAVVQQQYNNNVNISQRNNNQYNINQNNTNNINNNINRQVNGNLNNMYPQTNMNINNNNNLIISNIASQAGLIQQQQQQYQPLSQVLQQQRLQQSQQQQLQIGGLQLR